MKGRITVLLMVALFVLGISFAVAEASKVNVSEADTITVAYLQKGIPANSKVMVGLTIANSDSLAGLVIPLTFAEGLKCDSVTFSGGKANYFRQVHVVVINNNGENPNLPRKFLGIAAIPFLAISSDPDSIASAITPTGSNQPLVKIYFTTLPDWNSNQEASLDTVRWLPSSGLSFSNEKGKTFRPIFQNHPEGVGAELLGAAEDNEAVVPTEFKLEQNFPNPFNPETNIGFAVTKKGPVTVTILNILGQKVNTLVNEVLPPGKHQIKWNGKDDKGNTVASGTYFCKVVAEQEHKEAHIKMAVLK